MMKLIGREYEIDKLNKMLIPGQPDFLAVYGRRRVGKTFLIRQHLKDNIVFDFTGTKAGTTEQQLNNFYDEYLKRIKSRRPKQPLSSWQEAFSWIAAYLAKLPLK